jgi:hypothetical protein
MKFFLRPENPAEEDLFEPLRELRSPLSIESIRSLVLEHAAVGVSSWNHMLGVIAELFAVSVIGAILWNSSAPKQESSRAVAHSGIYSINSTVAAIASENSQTKWHHIAANRSFGIPVSSTEAIKISEAEVIPSIEARTVPITRSQIDRSNGSIPPSIVPASPIGSTFSEWFATASAGAVFSHIRMLGESAEIGLNNGWESLGIGFMNASGNRDEHDVLVHHSTASQLLFDENDQTFALLAGANFSIGPIGCKAECGPAFLFSADNYIDAESGAITPLSIHRRMGVEADFSANYSFSDFCQVGITGISTIQNTQFTSGLLVSVTLRP